MPLAVGCCALPRATHGGLFLHAEIQKKSSQKRTQQLLAGSATARPPKGDMSGGGEAFATELLRVAVSQICQDQGFDACEGSAADALVDVLRKYVHTVGVTVHEHCEGSQRTQPNLDDLLFTLPTLRPAMHLEELRDLSRHIDRAESGLGAAVCDVPAFPVVLPQPKLGSGGDDRGGAASGASSSSAAADSAGMGLAGSTPAAALPQHVPSFMPPLPERHTYLATQVDAVHRESSRTKLRDTFLSQKRLVQRSLNDISSSASSSSSGTADSGGAVKRARLEEALFGEGGGGGSGGAIRLAAPGAAGGSDSAVGGEGGVWPPTGASGWAGQGVARAGSVQDRYRELELNDKILVSLPRRTSPQQR